jgi:hypothetical protein
MFQTRVMGPTRQLWVIHLRFDVVDCVLETDGVSEKLIKIDAQVEQTRIPCTRGFLCGVPVWSRRVRVRDDRRPGISNGFVFDGWATSKWRV